MKATLLESVLGDSSGKFTDAEKTSLMESINIMVTEEAENKIKKVEERYASQFGAMTESVSTTLVEMVEDSFKKATEKVVKEDTINYLMENVNKIHGILEDMGLVTIGGDESLKKRMEEKEKNYKKALDLLKKSKELVDKKRDDINKLRVENYIRKAMAGMESELVEQAVSEFVDEDIDEIEDVLATWLDNEDFSMPSSPKEKDLSDDIDEDGIENDLEELDNMVNKGMFESEDGSSNLKKPEKNGKLDNIKGLSKLTSANGSMGDVSSAQLEALNTLDDSIFEDDNHQILEHDVDQAVEQIRSFGKTWSL